MILVTNDDGITSPGIKALADIATSFGRVCVVAPDKPQSGMGHAITVNSALQVKPVKFEKAHLAYSCTGTPADCVKVAIYHLLDEKPDLCLSGINHGSNISINVIYSGTMSAALEGALERIPSAGISLCNNDVNADLTAARFVTELLVKKMLAMKADRHLCLNVNIPAVPLSKIKGIHICRQGKGNWKEFYEEQKGDAGREYLWLTGTFENFEKQKTDTDLWALDNNYVSVAPIHADMTDYKELKRLKGLNISF